MVLFRSFHYPWADPSQTVGRDGSGLVFNVSLPKGCFGEDVLDGGRRALNLQSPPVDRRGSSRLRGVSPMEGDGAGRGPLGSLLGTGQNSFSGVTAPRGGEE